MLHCWRRTGHLPSFFVPTPGDLPAQESPPPGICHPRQKKCKFPGVSPGGGLGAGGIDWCISLHIDSAPLRGFTSVNGKAHWGVLFQGFYTQKIERWFLSVSGAHDSVCINIHSFFVPDQWYGSVQYMFGTGKMCKFNRTFSSRVFLLNLLSVL